MTDKTGGTRSRHTAGLFDIRNIIGALLGLDGLIITLAGIFGDAEEDKTGGINANLWTGLALLAAGIIFITWAQLRPVVVPDDSEPDDEESPAGH